MISVKLVVINNYSGLDMGAVVTCQANAGPSSTKLGVITVLWKVCALCRFLSCVLCEFENNQQLIIEL